MDLHGFGWQSSWNSRSDVLYTNSQYIQILDYCYAMNCLVGLGGQMVTWNNLQGRGVLVNSQGTRNLQLREYDVIGKRSALLTVQCTPHRVQCTPWTVLRTNGQRTAYIGNNCCVTSWDPFITRVRCAWSRSSRTTMAEIVTKLLA